LSASTSAATFSSKRIRPYGCMAQSDPAIVMLDRGFAEPGVSIMARTKKFTDPTDIAICEVHRRYVELMETVRLESHGAETKERYLAVLPSLTAKLAMPSKPLSEMVGEIMTEAGPLLFQAMQR